MELRVGSLLYKYAYFWSECYSRPDLGDHIDLCRLFWRIALLQPLKIVTALLFSGAFIFFIRQLVRLDPTTWFMFLTSLGIVGFAFILVEIYDHRIVQGFLNSWREKYCVHITLIK